MKNSEVKALELLTPITKKWTDFHLLVISTLIKVYETKQDEEAKNMVKLYRASFIEEGNYYVSYMKWAVKMIKKRRVADQSVSPRMTCGEWNFDYFVCPEFN